MKPRSPRPQDGFTLIEAIVVVVVLAIVAAVAVPKFLELQDEARRAASAGVAGSLGSASTANYVLRNGQVAVPTIPIANCTDIAALLLPGSMAGFVITPQPIAPNTEIACTVEHAGSSGTGAQFTGHGVL